MAERQITHVRRDRYGVTTDVGRPGVWTASVPTAIATIDAGTYNYFVQWPEKRTEVRVINASPRYLRTDRDGTAKNNLDDLPTF